MTGKKATPDHVKTQAVGKQDLKHMQQSDEERQAAYREEAEKQFGNVTQSPDIEPEVAGDVVVEPRK